MAEMVKGISKKQAGVVYGAIKRGEIVTDKPAGLVYDFTECIVCHNGDIRLRAEACVKAIRETIGAIFANSMEDANKAYGRFIEAY